MVGLYVLQDMSVTGIFSADNQAGQKELPGVTVTYTPDLSRVSWDALQGAKVSLS